MIRFRFIPFVFATWLMTQASAGRAMQSQEPEPSGAAHPFKVGERLDYEVKFGPLSVGHGSMEILGIESIRGHGAFHTKFTVNGGVPFYRVNDVYESWFDTTDVTSYRYLQTIREGGYKKDRRYEVMPDSGVYIDNGVRKATVSQPLDDGSFLYFIRTVPLEIGKTYTFDRYFEPEKNPVVISVVRRERIQVPAGTFDCVVLRPSIKTTGIFSDKGHAEVWVSDDSRRLMVQMKAGLSFGTLNLYLRSIGQSDGK